MPESLRRRLQIMALMAAILGLQIGVSYALSRGELPPASPELGTIPAEIGDWRLAGERALDQDVAAYLRPDDYIQRIYGRPRQAAGDERKVELFVAYFKSLKSGYAPHSPSVCLPGAGWKPLENSIRQAAVPGPAAIPVNEYILEKAGQNILLWYWYQNERRVWAEEFRAKLYLLPDLMRYHRSDAALVRVTIPLDRNAIEDGRTALSQFVRASYPLLKQRFSSIQ